jgi:hypothetical protein
MGTMRENGYSATVEGFLVAGGTRYRLAKTNGVTLVLADACELPPATEAELLIIVDGQGDSKQIVLPDGVAAGQTCVRYEQTVPF